MSDQSSQANLAATLADILPDTKLLFTHTTDVPGLYIAQVAVPKNHSLQEIRVDLESHLPSPRKTKARGSLRDVESFLSYVARHQDARTVVWCNFNPQTYDLSFTAVIDEHTRDAAGWRQHTATFTPTASAEWATWISANKQPKQQVEFAEFLERQEGDIAVREGYPTSLDMMTMATNFEATSEKRLISSVRLQGGGVTLEYKDGDNEDTIQKMKVFERFCIGIPVFWAGAAYMIEARLKHRSKSGTVSFHYELIRPDRVHEAAAKDVVEFIKKGIGSVPMMMGECKQ